MQDKREDRGLKHVVMWRLQDSPAKVMHRTNAKQQLEGLSAKIPDISNLEVGLNLTAGGEGDYDVVLTITVTDKATLKRVLEHPEYLHIKTFLNSMSAASHAVDYDRQIHPSQTLRELINAADTLVMPDAYDALSAQLIERAGFQAVQCSGYSMAMAAGLSDECGLSRDYNLQMTKLMVDAVSVPVMADGEDGYGGPDAVGETVCKFMDVGVAGINIEDQVLDGEPDVKTIDQKVMIEKIENARQAADRFGSSGMVINARTDVLRAGPDRQRQLVKAAQRANAYLKAGADLIFIPYVADLHEVAFLKEEILGPISIAAGLKYNQKAFDLNDLSRLGVARVSLPTFAIHSAMKHMWHGLNQLQKTGSFNFISAES